MKLLRQLRRVGGTASVMMELAARLAFLRVLEDAPELRWRAAVLHQVAKLLLDVHSIVVDEQGSPPAAPALIVSNHVNYLDPIVVLARAPALPIAKSEVRRWPLIGGLCEGSGVQFVTRSCAGSRAAALRTMTGVLRGGVSILNFPEGTTTDGARVLPLRPAGFAAALRAQVPVVPVAIRWESRALGWTGDASFVPHYLEVASRKQIRVWLRWGEPLAGATDLELSHRAHRFLARALEESHAAAERV